MRRLFDLFGVLTLVLLLSAFDERAAEQTVTRARSELTDAWSRISQPAAPTSALPVRAVDNAVRGDFVSDDDTSAWPMLHADGARLDLSGAGVIQTRPYRIATGSEPPLAVLNLSASHQVELREIVGIAPANGGQPLCAEYPARYLALASRGRTLRLLAFTDRPEGEQRPCADLAFGLP
jgi:hypothetical protein